MRCIALQCIAWGVDWCQVPVLQCIAVCCSELQWVAVRCSVLQCPAVPCSVLQCVAVRCSTLQSVAVRCSALQCVAVRCSALRFPWASGADWYVPPHTHSNSHQSRQLLSVAPVILGEFFYITRIVDMLLRMWIYYVMYIYIYIYIYMYIYRTWIKFSERGHITWNVDILWGGYD